MFIQSIAPLFFPSFKHQKNAFATSHRENLRKKKKKNTSSPKPIDLNNSLGLHHPTRSKRHLWRFVFKDELATKAMNLSIPYQVRCHPTKTYKKRNTENYRICRGMCVHTYYIYIYICIYLLFRYILDIDM